MFVITGTPRSATGYASILLSNADVVCTHERYFRPRLCMDELLRWWNMPDTQHGESSWLAWAFAGLFPHPIPLIHTLRNPWTVIDSLAFRNDILPEDACIGKGKEGFRTAIRAYCPEVYGYKTDVDRAAAMVVYWNQRIFRASEQYALPYRFYRVEELNADMLRDILEWLDIGRDQYELAEAMKATPRDVNAGKKLSYNQELTDPGILAIMDKAMPGHAPIIGRVAEKDTPRSPEQIEAMMDPRLIKLVREHADVYGYSRDETQRSFEDGSAQLFPG